MWQISQFGEFVDIDFYLFVKNMYKMYYWYSESVNKIDNAVFIKLSIIKEKNLRVFKYVVGNSVFSTLNNSIRKLIRFSFRSENEW